MREILEREYRAALRRLEVQANAVDTTAVALRVATECKMISVIASLDAKLKRQEAAAAVTKAVCVELEAALCAIGRNDAQTDAFPSNGSENVDTGTSEVARPFVGKPRKGSGTPVT